MSQTAPRPEDDGEADVHPITRVRITLMDGRVINAGHHMLTDDEMWVIVSAAPGTRPFSKYPAFNVQEIEVL